MVTVPASLGDGPSLFICLLLVGFEISFEGKAHLMSVLSLLKFHRVSRR